MINTLHKQENNKAVSSFPRPTRQADNSQKPTCKISADKHINIWETNKAVGLQSIKHLKHWRCRCTDSQRRERTSQYWVIMEQALK